MIVVEAGGAFILAWDFRGLLLVGFLIVVGRLTLDDVVLARSDT